MNPVAQVRSEAEWKARALSCPECTAGPLAECKDAAIGSLLGVHSERVVAALLRPEDVEARLRDRRYSSDPRLRAAAGRAQLAGARQRIAAVASSRGVS